MGIALRMGQARYEDHLTLREGLDTYFAHSGFGRDTYTDRWVRLPLGPLTLKLPNLPARKIVLPLHDVDHVVSEYPTDWVGELSIAGYELGAGLGKYWFGWLVNLQGLMLGLIVCPRQCFRAFVRGRRSGSLFCKFTYNNALLSRTLGELRAEIPVAPRKQTATLGDTVTFASFLAFAVALHAPIAIAAVWGVMGLMKWLA